MLTVAYCRVSTTEQAEEGFSIDGQADKLRQYALLHDLGEVTVISDPGLSGKNMARPGLQRLLAMVDAGHVGHVLIWRLDRLSRNLGDLIELADHLGSHDVGLHSFTEKLDLSSATGRMFYNVLGSFAQFYREQLAENVTMGLHQAIRQGRWVNRPPKGYDLDHGVLVANHDADTVRRVFRLRGEAMSNREISEHTGVHQSTVIAIVKNRAYLGEIPFDGGWVPGLHEPLVTVSVFDAAHRGRVSGRRRGKDLMSGRVICGLCRRRMSIEQNGQGQAHYRCRHRGQGCQIPSRSNRGLLRAAGLGLALLCDQEIREAIRKHLEAMRRTDGTAARRSAPGAAERLTGLRTQRDKLLRLHLNDQISAEQFGEQQAIFTIEIDNLEAEANNTVTEHLRTTELGDHFNQLVELLDRINIADLWNAATDTERRTLLDELLASVTVHPDRLIVHINGAPPLTVTLTEVGLKDSENTHDTGVS